MQPIYSTQFYLPQSLLKGSTNLLQCPIYLSGALVVPDSSGTVVVRNAGGTVVLTETAPIVSSIATYTTDADAFDAESFSNGWTVDWQLTIDGVVCRFRQLACLVTRPLYPVIADIDLFKVIPSLDPTSPKRISTASTFQDQIKESWIQLLGRLIADGARPDLIVEGNALRQAHIFLTLNLIFQELAVRQPDVNQPLADLYLNKYETDFLRIRYDEDKDSNLVPDGRKSSATQTQGTLWLNRGQRA